MYVARQNFPDFLGIGTTKAGTTWLYKQLCRHPGLWMTPNKEISFFMATQPAGAGRENPRYKLGHDLLRYGWYRDLARFLFRLRSMDDLEHLRWWARYYCGHRDDRWYRSLFARAPQGTLAGEFTPRYETCGEVDIQHMYAIAPEAKLLFMIREPIGRFWSHFKMNRARGLAPGEVLDEGRNLLLGPDGQAKLIYRRTLQNYTKFFRPEQILIVFYEAITQDPHRLLAEIFQFLGVPHREYTSSELTERINEGSISLPLPEPLRFTAAEKYRADVEALAQVLGGYAADWWDQLNSPDSKATPVERIRPPTVRLTGKIMARLE